MGYRENEQLQKGMKENYWKWFGRVGWDNVDFAI